MKLTFTPEDFTPVDNQVLIQPGPVKKIKTLQPQVSNTMDVKGTDIKEQTYAKEATAMRVGQVLAIGDNIKERVNYQVGDWIVYNTRGGYHKKLDLLAKRSDDDKCPIIMLSHEILTKVKIN